MRRCITSFSHLSSLSSWGGKFTGARFYSNLAESFVKVFEREILLRRFQDHPPLYMESVSIRLSQRDLLTSLKSLCMVKYSDVRNRVLAGLETLLQQRGLDIDPDGWYY